MQRIIQIKLAGHVVSIDDNAFILLRDYLNTIERQFEKEKGKEEILEDIENRIAELFLMRLSTGASCIDSTDVLKVIETLGPAYSMDGETEQKSNPYLPETYIEKSKEKQSFKKRIFRNPNDKVLGGVCSGVANYFDVDPVLVRVVWAILFFGAGFGLLAYGIAWIVIPYPRTPQEMEYMTDGIPMDYQTIKKNVKNEMQDLKQRGEEMSKELRDFFGNKRQ